jgi:molecular chaperone HtpG
MARIEFMATSLDSRAELKAAEAERLPAFAGLNLFGIKNQVAELVALIGRNGIFDEYTRHDISHIGSMLASLDWLIPDRTKNTMSPADWLIIVLAVYFHDLGMLVTHREYASRDSSGFPQYRDIQLLGGEHGADYAARLSEMASADAERFLYQEFVRHKHAERVRDWIMGRSAASLGVADDVAHAVEELLQALRPQFRRDLALVCESHHLDDLNDFARYKIHQPYGNSPKETANLQYAALILRTADLLDITRDRTPSIVFKVINPANPLSQEEWAKQLAVTSVRPKLGLDREGRPSEDVPRDTIEVHAYFKDPAGFFGLTSYLSFVTEQLRKSYMWAKQAQAEQASRFEFPWRYLDDRNIETEGFLRDTFEFTIDQAKILELLTGQTLYNDTQIVIRELVQNSLDAIRVQRLLLDPPSRVAYKGLIAINWSSQTRFLSVQDNGTGISQDSIERHLLRVGSSRYQDPEFTKEFPDFSPISRFGIGLLSIFMVADEVEIITCSPLDAQARQLSIRYVDGRYLIRLLDKETDPAVRHLSPNGTLIRLKVRHKADMGDLLRAVRKWVVIPECDVTVQIDAQEPVRIGFSSPREALLDGLIARGTFESFSDDSRIKVEERTLSGVTVAYALEWSEYFREWKFLEASSVLGEVSDDDSADGAAHNEFFGTCIEGIRVEFNTPGFLGRNIVAIANATGPGAPKTNVVRSGLETTPQRDAMLSTVYSIYLSYIESEIRALQERKFSLTWATQEARYLLAPFSTGEGEVKPQNMELLVARAKDLPLLVIEVNGKREAVSAITLAKHEHFWIVDSAFFRSAESLLKEIPGAASLAGVVAGIEAGIRLPEGVFLSQSAMLESSWAGALRDREVDRLIVIPEERRVDLRWGWKASPPRWQFIGARDEDTFDLSFRGRARRGSRATKVFVKTSPVKITGLSSATAVRGFNGLYLVVETPLAKFVIDWIGRGRGGEERAKRGRVSASAILGNMITIFYERPEVVTNELMQDDIRSAFRAMPQDSLDLAELLEAAARTELKAFDPAVWRRSLLDVDDFF